MAKAIFLGVISLILLILEVVLFKFTGILGLVLCIGLVYLIVGSIIRVINVLVDIKLFNDLDILFFMDKY